MPLDLADLPLVHAGKIRSLYALDDERLLLVASDRISAYDFVLTPEVPEKGAVLTQLSAWWFERLDDIVDHHVIPADRSADVTAALPADLAARSLVCERLEMLPVECVVRGHLTGSGLADYRATGRVSGIALPEGLRDGDRLPEPIFTPSTKAALGDHDEAIDFDAVVATVGGDVAERLRALSLALYARAGEIAAERGILLADTKFEFGRRRDGTVVLADEVLTPDSSRYWDAATWQPGVRLDSFDKQFVRDWLTRDSGWDRSGDAPPPPLPADIVAATRERYVEAWRRLTGRAWPR